MSNKTASKKHRICRKKHPCGCFLSRFHIFEPALIRRKRPTSVAYPPQEAQSVTSSSPILKKHPCFRQTPVLNKKNTEPSVLCFSLVDDTRLELVTSRTASGCATSCANRPFIGNEYFTRCRCVCQYFFLNSLHKPWFQRFCRSRSA